ncbi:MAG: sugar ABC transporter permease [Chloroflexi bacterium]|nr:sugar ABC transporter permease [Chloroflexota bacterium]
MQKTAAAPRGNARIAAGVTFIVIWLVIMFIALLNAPTRGGPQVMATVNTYLAEVRKTALPFLGAVGILAAIIGGFAAVMVHREWPNRKHRSTMIAGYAFLAPYLLVTLTFTIGVIFFAFYISFNNYSIFVAPTWVGLQNYARAFAGFTNSFQSGFIHSLYNVIWYALIVVPLQTALAIALAVLLNSPMRLRQFFRTVFYAPSVTSSVVITMIFIWMYLKTGYMNFFLAKIFGLFGGHWSAVDWLNDPSGLVQLLAGLVGIHISLEQWYFAGPSVAWMAIMFQNIFTTAPTFMIMFLAALQDINPALYEAAAIDGASGWHRFWSITLPLLRPIVLLVVVLGTIGTLQVFDQVYLATQGGPLNTTQTPVFQIYNQALGTTGPIQMGYASALAFILGVIIFVFTFVQRRFLERGTEVY